MLASWSSRFLSFDTETTGLGEEARILELGLVLYDAGKRVSTWSSLFNPPDVNWESSSVQGALAVNKLTRDELLGKPTFEEALEEIMGEMDEVVWVAHNADFDLRMLRQEFRRIGKSASEPILVLDTMALDAHLNPGQPKYRLDVVAPRWGVTPDGEHRAVADAAACGDVLNAMLASGRLPLANEEMGMMQKTAGESWRSRRGRYGYK